MDKLETTGRYISSYEKSSYSDKQNLCNSLRRLNYHLIIKSTSNNANLPAEKYSF